MPSFDIHRAMEILRRVTPQWQEPIVTQMVKRRRDPYKVLISTMISLRTKDDVTREASERLYELADTPQAMLDLSEDAIAQAIYPAGFYKTKARDILAASRRIVEEFGGETPKDIDTLTTFRGVGRKTANLVLTLGYGLPGICVDTHVHRICNRWGYVRTKTPDDTEKRLRMKLPKEYWIPINDLLVTYGQNLCVPISPWCSKCELSELCRRVGVQKSR